MIVLQYRLDKIGIGDVRDIVKGISETLKGDNRVIAIPDIVSYSEMSVEELEQVRDMLQWVILEAKERIKNGDSNN